jgi:molybdate transport system substrate-binding protein
MRAAKLKTIRRLFGRRKVSAVLASLAALALPCGMAAAKDIPVAVAANFTEPAQKIAEAFHAKTGYTLALSFGSSGQFYTQITQGAPFEVFLSADSAHPEKLEAEGEAVPKSVFAYALGTLVLWSADSHLVDARGAVLQTGRFRHLANANPELAPYGAAGLQTLKALGLYETLAPRIVTAANITQAYQFVAGGDAELGFVALSQVIHNHSGSEWIVPAKLYAPIVQDAVLLKTGEHDPGAAAFVTYLKSDAALAIIRNYGYRTQ